MDTFIPSGESSCWPLTRSMVTRAALVENKRDTFRGHLLITCTCFEKTHSWNTRSQEVFFKRRKLHFFWRLCHVWDTAKDSLRYLSTELGRLLTNCSQLLIPNYMTKTVVSNVIHYITQFSSYNQTTFWLLWTKLVYNIDLNRIIEQKKKIYSIHCYWQHEGVHQ